MEQYTTKRVRWFYLSSIMVLLLDSQSSVLALDADEAETADIVGDSSRVVSASQTQNQQIPERAALSLDFLNEMDNHNHNFCPVNYNDPNHINNSSIDSNHNIVFKSLDYQQNFKLAAFVGCKEDTDLDAVMNLAKEVILSSGKVDFDAMAKMMNDSRRVEGTKQFVLGQWAVFLVAGIGLLAAIYIPIVSCCFCCCRCSGKCGGRPNLIDARQHKKKWCLTTGTLLFFSMAVLLFGMGGIYIMGLRMLQTPDYLMHVANFTVDDVILYKDEIFDQLDQVADKDLDFTVAGIASLVSNSGVHISAPFMTAGGVIITSIRNNLDTIQTRRDTVDSMLSDLNVLIADIHSNYSAVNTHLTDTRNKVKIRFDNCGSSSMQSVDCPLLPTDTHVPAAYDFTQTPTFGDQETFMASIGAADLSSIKNQIDAEFQKIPERITNSSESTLSVVDATMTNISNIISPQLDEMHSQIDNATVSIEDLRVGIHDMNRMSKDYIRFGNYGLMGLSGIVFLIVLFTFLGLLHGICVIKYVEKPTQRTVLGHCGRNCLMTSVYLAFIFATLFFLLGSILFFIGAQMTLLCKPIQNLDILETLDEQLSSPGEYYLGNAILGNDSIPLTMKKVVSGCKENEAVYHTLMLYHLLDVTTIVDIEAQMPNMSDIYHTIQSDMVGVTVVPPGAVTALTALNSTSAYPMDIPTMTSGLLTGIAALRPLLEDIAGLLQNASVRSWGHDIAYYNDYIAEKNDIDSVINNNLVILESSIAELHSLVVDIQSHLGTILTSVDATIDGMTDIEAFIPGQGATLLTTGTDDYIRLVLSYATQFVEHLDSRLRQDVARCHVVYDVYNGVTHSVCSFFLNPLNGFWLSLSTVAVFLVVNIILGVRLAKYLRRIPDQYIRRGHIASRRMTYEVQQRAQSKA